MRRLVVGGAQQAGTASSHPTPPSWDYQKQGLPFLYFRVKAVLTSKDQKEPAVGTIKNTSNGTGSAQSYSMRTRLIKRILQ